MLYHLPFKFMAKVKVPCGQNRQTHGSKTICTQSIDAGMDEFYFTLNQTMTTFDALEEKVF